MVVGATVVWLQLHSHYPTGSRVSSPPWRHSYGLGGVGFSDGLDGSWLSSLFSLRITDSEYDQLAYSKATTHGGAIYVTGGGNLYLTNVTVRESLLQPHAWEDPLSLLLFPSYVKITPPMGEPLLWRTVEWWPTPSM